MILQILCQYSISSINQAVTNVDWLNTIIIPNFVKCPNQPAAVKSVDTFSCFLHITFIMLLYIG